MVKTSSMNWNIQRRGYSYESDLSENAKRQNLPTYKMNQNSEAPNENILEKYLTYHLLLS